MEKLFITYFSENLNSVDHLSLFKINNNYLNHISLPVKLDSLNLTGNNLNYYFVYLSISLLIIFVILLCTSKRPYNYVDVGVQTNEDWDTGAVVNVVYKRILSRNNEYKYFIYNENEFLWKNIPKYFVRTDLFIQINEPEAVEKRIGNRVYSGVVLDRLPVLRGSNAVYINPERLKILKERYIVQTMGTPVVNERRKMKICQSAGEDIVEN